MVPLLSYRSHPSFHCWLNFLSPRFRCSTRFQLPVWVQSNSSHTLKPLPISSLSTTYLLVTHKSDTMLWPLFRPDVPVVLSSLSACVNDLNSLYSSLCLQLNPLKTEFILFGSIDPSSNLAKISHEQCSVTVTSSSIPQTVGNLGVIFDSELSMKSHISKIASACVFHPKK